MPTGMIDNVRGNTLPLEWLKQIGETPERNRVLKSLMEESDDNNDDLSMDEIKTSRSSKDSVVSG
jgi:hypothetical protein